MVLLADSKDRLNSILPSSSFDMSRVLFKISERKEEAWRSSVTSSWLYTLVSFKSEALVTMFVTKFRISCVIMPINLFFADSFSLRVWICNAKYFL